MKTAAKDAILLCAVGDVAAFRRNPDWAFEHVGPVLRQADIGFAQNERHYSNSTDVSAFADGSKVTPTSGFTELTSVKNAQCLKEGGFHVVSFASNHTMDLGVQAMLETVGVLNKLGFAVIGAGKNLREARKPAIIERKGTRVAFLAYSSVSRAGYEAGPEKAGVAPMRAYTHYHQSDYQPGTRPLILSFPYRDDLKALVEDVKKVRALADIVVVSMHWGIHLERATIAMYQKEVAHTVIDAGADMILGHHPHVLKGIEVYKGKPIFYSLGNFTFDLQPEVIEQWCEHSPSFTELMKVHDWHLDPKWTMYGFPPESRKSMIMKCVIAGKTVRRVSFLPVLINRKAQPRPVLRKSRDFDKLFEYMKDISVSQGFDTSFSIEGDEIVVSLD